VPSHIPPGRGLLVSAFAAVVAFLFGAAICNDFLVAQKRWTLREIAQDAAIAAVLVLSDETASLTKRRTPSRPPSRWPTPGPLRQTRT
jgi:hypothetical protein